MAHSEATKLKISTAHRGMKKPWSSKVGLSKRGITLSEEHRKKIGQAILGRKESVETRKRKSLSMMGKNFKGGPKTSKLEKDKIRKSLEYKLWRETVFTRDNFQCQMPGCTSTERYVEANHIKRFCDYPELRFEKSNGITLCRVCHKHIYRREPEFEKLFKQIILWH